MADYVCMYLCVAGCDDHNAGVDVDEKEKTQGWTHVSEEGEKVCNW